MAVPKDPIEAENYKKRLSESLKGRTLTDEHKQKMRLSKLRKPTRYWLGKSRKNYVPQNKDSWYQRNCEYAKAKRKVYYQSILEERAGRPRPLNCESCGNTGRICYDHCHNTGKFRGWLCEHCNVLLGFARDNKETLYQLIQYLEKNS